MSMKKLDLGSLMAFSFVAGLAIIAYIFKVQFMEYIRMVLAGGQLKVVLLLAIIAIIVTHAFKVKPGNDTSNVMIRSGLIPLDTFLTLGTYVAVTTTACSLIEGAFMQQFFEITYFTKFGELDVYVLLGVGALLLWYVAFHMYRMSIEILFKVEEVSTPSKGILPKPVPSSSPSSTD